MQIIFNGPKNSPPHQIASLFLFVKFRFRCLKKKLEFIISIPIAGLKGMTELNRDAFNAVVDVPFVSMHSKQLSRFMPQLKSVILKGIRTVSLVLKRTYV